MKKIKLTYIISTINKGNAYEWISKNLDSTKFSLSFILLHNKEPHLEKYLKENNIDVVYIPFYGKKSYLKTLFRIFFILAKTRPHIVHTHFFDANLIGLTAAWLLNIKKRIYTRHHSTFHHENYPNAIKYDKWSNKIATHIIAITGNVKNVLINMEGVKEKKISLVHHGFDLGQIANKNNSKIETLKEKYNLQESHPIIGVVARYINWKGIQYIIPAFNKILIEYPNAKLILANAIGPDKESIQKQLKNLPINTFIEIPFENDIFSLYHLFDIYVHTPINNEIEAFGQTYIEALASGIPSVFTLSGIANDFIENNKNALVVNYKNSEDIYDKITSLLSDKNLTANIILNGKESVKPFNLDTFVNQLQTLYLN